MSSRVLREKAVTLTSGLARLENLRSFQKLPHLAAADFFASLSALSHLIRPLSPAQSVARAINHDQDVQAVKFVVQQTSFGRGRRGLWPFILIGAFTSAD